MDFKQIQELIKMVNKSNIGEVTVEDNGQRVTIKQKKDPAPVYASQPVMSAAVAAPQAAAPAAANTAAKSAGGDTAPAAPASNLITIKSSMIGTFYRSPGPGKDAFVNIGDKITGEKDKPGTVLCIIEAMKIMNRIESEVSGTIVEVLVDDNTAVDYDTPLFSVKPD